MDFKERIFQARKAKGFSQEELAALVGVSRQAVSKWETGEAMPDLEKLIALCDALELNMEYLALGKASAQTAEVPKKPNRWLAAVLALLLAVVCLVIGFMLAQLLSVAQEPLSQQTPVSDEPVRQEPIRQEPIQIEIGVIEPKPENTGDRRISNVTATAAAKKRIEVSVLPTQLTEGLELELLCEDKITGNTDTLPCTFDGNYYRVMLSRPEQYHYCITALLTENGEMAQIPILEIEGDRSHFRTHHLWESSQ